MKHILSLLLLGICITGCDSKDNKEELPDTGPNLGSIFAHSYILVYEDGVWAAKRGISEDICDFYLTMTTGRDQNYQSPDLTGDPCPRFTELAERNGDTNYNREIFLWQTMDRYACADNYKAVRVVCPNGDWDNTHPAGTSLNDLILIEYFSDAKMIETDDYELTSTGTLKALSSLAEDDLKIIGGRINLFFSNFPKQSGLKLQITMETTDGKEKIVECDVDRQEITE